MGGTMQEHSEPLLESARDGSSDIEEGIMREKAYAPTKFYEKKPFLFASTVNAAVADIDGSAAPVQDHVRYKTVVFDASLGKKTIYMEDPSPRVDRAWEDLYDFGISWITPSEASQLPNATSRLVENPSRFVTGLDVFHQLHCLNLIRKRLNPEYYVNDTHVHVEHCLDQLRQALMCSADTATIPWTWSKGQGRTIADARTTHTCRDYDAIREWAKERKVEGGFAKDTYVEGSAMSD
ncbi:hypothetical protein SLS60_007701 [Paraconiothyrium brasiliense]|uniref:Tat pathway signal sequence n=1 Tax=Paraconiothyrium brasiliense TaxID=300254 RepID=A0ABR3R647_9PLEO